MCLEVGLCSTLFSLFLYTRSIVGFSEQKGRWVFFSIFRYNRSCYREFSRFAQETPKACISTAIESAEVQASSSHESIQSSELSTSGSETYDESSFVSVMWLFKLSLDTVLVFKLLQDNSDWVIWIWKYRFS